ncbi:MAG TPA: tyrosine-type recombinase/integrase [Cytophagaceae bacterium]|jgi:integrase|nr:tyrosine-type recombinase/integrase [Cytophagaceae bacterium]
MEEEALGNQGLSSFIEDAASLFASVSSYELQLAHLLGLVPKEPYQNLFQFRKPRVVIPKSKAQRGYIIFYVWDVQQNSLSRKRDYELNNYNTESERKAFSKQRKDDIHNLLKQGYHVDKAKVIPADLIKDKICTLAESIDRALRIKLPELRRRTQFSYKSTSDDFKSYLERIGKASIPPIYLKRRDVLEYSDYLITKRKLGAKTRNNYFSYLRSLFTVLELREYIEKNPFIGIGDLPIIHGSTHKPFSDEQIEILKKEIPQRDPILWNFIQFIFYCFLRPAEIAQLKIEFVEWDKNKILIPAKISKNRKDGRVNIPLSMKEILQKMKLKRCAKHLFIFSKEGIPGEIKILDNEMTKRHRKILDELNFSKQHTLYSWKHTGNVKLYYSSNKDIILIMKQNRHHSLDMTYNYLRSLGLEINSSVLENFQL